MDLTNNFDNLLISGIDEDAEFAPIMTLEE
jgi:hypothetical protein